MKSSLCRILVIPVIAMAASCARQHPETILASVDDALSFNDYRAAQSLCDNLTEIAHNDSMALLPSHYCRLAIDYMILAEHQSASTASADDNISVASSMFNTAIRISADSVQAFLEEIAPEENGHAAILIQLAEAAEAREMLFDEFEESDSTAIASDHDHHDHEHEIQ
ncbi:MAG: hypothetical protein K2K64_08070 [Muribaculaceae bacterium]|nr:hypothetical protein [Muribaculaceae bacterium]